MSRDKRLNRTQEVDGSSPFSSTKENKRLSADAVRQRFCFVCKFVCNRNLFAYPHGATPSIREQLALKAFPLSTFRI